MGRRHQVAWLYSNGRGFPERKHTHTTLFDHIGAAYRDADPVPVELALDHAYDGIVVAWFDAREGNTARVGARHAHRGPPARAARRLLHRDRLVVDPGRRRRPPTSRWTSAPPPAAPSASCRSSSSHGDVTEALAGLRTYTDAVAEAGLADVHLVAPFFRTVVGTDTYVDELW